MAGSRLAGASAAVLASLMLAAPVTAAADTAAGRPADQGAQIARLFGQLTRDTPWKLVGSVALQTDTWHPEGIVRTSDGWLVSSVQVTEPTQKYPAGQLIGGTDRTPGAGFGHVLRFDAAGRLLSDRVLNAAAALEYHPGGLDDDGRNVWVTLAQYRPNTTSTFLRLRPRTLAVTKVLEAGDHFGGVVHDTARKRLVTLNWGSREGAIWRLPRRARLGRAARPAAVVANPSHFVDYQDCKYLGRVPRRRHPLMLCGGITQFGAFQLGGMALVDTVTLAPVHEVPMTTLSPAGNVLTRNPIDVEVVDGRLRVHLAPDDDSTTVFTYEAEL
jgi:hypothetical protein